jgi:hypothetical protein
MLELISLLFSTLARLSRKRRDLVVENLLLRHQLHVALRSRPRPDLKTRDRFFWMLVRRLVPDWKQHLILVQPDCRALAPPRLAALLALALRPPAGPAPIEP